MRQHMEGAGGQSRSQGTAKVVVLSVVPVCLAVAVAGVVRQRRAEDATQKMFQLWKEPAADPAALEELIAQGADVNRRWPSIDNRNSLHLAASCGAPAIKVVLDHGVDVNSRDKNGYTPLIFAVYSVDSQSVRLLLSRGADPNIVPARHASFGTPLHEAREWARVHQDDACAATTREIVQALLAAGARE